MTTRYVATTGSDTTGNGTSGNPYATISKAATVAVAGDTITVADGTYNGNFTTNPSGTSGSRITYKSTNRFGARLVGTGIQDDHFWNNNGAFVTIDGFVISTTGS